jgi:hypothetical protein
LTDDQNEDRRVDRSGDRSEQLAGEQTSAERRELEALQRELEAARSQLTDLEGLLGELPQIFENKFQERLQPMLEQQRLIVEENQDLLDQVRHVLGSGDPPGGRPALPAGRSVDPAGPPNAPGPSSRSKGAAIPAPEPAPAAPPDAVGVFIRQWRKETIPAPRGSVGTQEEGGSETAIIAQHWVLPRWVPEGLSIERLRRLAGLTALSAGVAMLVAAAVVLWQRQLQPVPLTSRPVAERSSSSSSSSQGQEVEFTSSGVSWLDVRDADGASLFAEELKGTRRFPLGRGLKVLAGRPDLVTVRVGQGPPRELGRVDQVEWMTIKAPSPPRP